MHKNPLQNVRTALMRIWQHLRDVEDDLQWIREEMRLSRRRPVERFSIYRVPSNFNGNIHDVQEIDMATTTLAGIAPGATATFVATPEDASGNPATLPAGIVPTWTSSDPTNAPVTASADGLSATVTLTADAVAEDVTLTIDATLASGATPSGTAAFPILAPAAAEVASFSIAQQS